MLPAFETLSFTARASRNACGAYTASRAALHMIFPLRREAVRTQIDVRCVGFTHTASNRNPLSCCGNEAVAAMQVVRSLALCPADSCVEHLSERKPSYQSLVPVRTIRLQKPGGGGGGGGGCGERESGGERKKVV